jgi:2-polyprenyl-3-methyl-5-hydroxy-6-metoxy-1,4-benzoquinol methylase
MKKGDSMNVPNMCPACGVKRDFPNVVITETDEKEEFRLYRCSKCGLLFVYPVPLIQRFFQNELTRTSLPSEKWIMKMRSHYRKVLRACEAYLSPGSRILDFACGFGYFLAVAAEAGYYVEGIDISPCCRQYIAKHLPNITVYSQLGELPRDIEKFDLVTAFEVLCYLPCAGETLQKLQGLLRPGGRIFVGVSANRGWLLWLLSCFKGSPLKLKKDGWLTDGLLNSRAYYAFSNNSLIQLLKSVGFTDFDRPRLRPPAPENPWYRVMLFLWLACAHIVRVFTLGKVDVYMKAHVIGRYTSGDDKHQDNSTNVRTDNQ